jgi:hypothetical protein
MKKIIAFLIVVIIGINCFAQQAATLPPITKTDYLQKSKNQKGAASVLLGGGVAMGVMGIIIFAQTFTISTNMNPTGAIIATVGFLAAAASIPLFIASGKNKKKARTVSTGFIMEKTRAIQGASIVNRSYPALSMKIGL